MRAASSSAEEHYGEDDVYLGILRHCAAAICQCTGFTSAENAALTLMSQALGKYLEKLCIYSRECCEHSGRTSVNLLDAQHALNLAGTKLADLNYYLNAPAPRILIDVDQEPSPPPPPSTLKICDNIRAIHTPHVPSFLPPLPDPHTYMRTEISMEPESSYERVRELSAINRRNAENALENYMLSIAPSTSLYRHLEANLVAEAKRVIDIQESENAGDDPFAVKESEKSYVRKHIPTWCQILLPDDVDDEGGAKPAYLPALLNDEEVCANHDEEKSNYFASILNREIEGDDGADETIMDTSVSGPDETILSFMNLQRK